MKRLALVAAVMTIAACTAKDTKTETPADSAAATVPAPAPAATDTGMKMDSTMKHDSATMKDTMAKTAPTKS